MNLSSALSPGVLAGLLAVAGAVSIAIGKPALGAFFNDPGTATSLTAVITGGVSLVAGILKGIETKS